MGIRIKLSKKYMLTSDKKQFILNKIKIAKETKKNNDGEIIVRKGDEILFPFGFYPTLESALKQIPDRIVMDSNATSFLLLKKKYQKTIDRILSRK